MDNFQPWNYGAVRSDDPALTGRGAQVPSAQAGGAPAGGAPAEPQRPVLVLNGPNLGRLGRREPEIYGHTTHGELARLCATWGHELGFDVEVVQTNHEGELLDLLNAAADDGTPATDAPSGAEPAARDSSTGPEEARDVR